MRPSLLPFRTATLVVVLFFAVQVPASAQLLKTVALLKGEIASTAGDHPSGATISIYKGTDKIATTRTNPDGKFTAVVPPDGMYRITVNHPSFIFAEDSIAVPASDKYEEIAFHTTIRPLRDGQSFDFPTPVFLQGSARLEASIADQLEDIVSALKHNPKLTLGITVYPDKQLAGVKASNEDQLVAQREAAIVSFFLSRNITSKTVTVSKSSAVPAEGRFPQTVTIAGKKKKSKPTTVTVLVPQYIDIVAHLS